MIRNNFFTIPDEIKVKLPDNVKSVLQECKSIIFYDTTAELADAATAGKENNSFEVKYFIPGKGEFTEAIVHRVKNGISANYPEPYMRRRDPDTMIIADDLPTDKQRFTETFGYDFATLQTETFY